MEGSGIYQEAIYLDLAVAAFLVLSAVLSAKAGLVRAVLSLAAWLLAIGLSALIFPIMEPSGGPGSPPTALDDVILDASLLLSLLATFLLAAYFVGRWFEHDDIGVIDRIFGFFLGLLRGGFILSVVYLLAGILQPPQAHPNWLRQAMATPLMAEGADMLGWLAPEWVLDMRLTLERAREEAEAGARETHRRRLEKQQKR